jgi:hypothetical protein
MRRGRVVWLALGAVVVAAQFVGYARTNPPASSALLAPPDVKRVLSRACFDCHSNQTEWPWYSAVAPLSWLLVHDVIEGRRRLNFSEWGDYASDPETASHKLEQVAATVANGSMAPWYYQVLHPSARLSAADRALLLVWAQAGSAHRSPTP